MRLDTYEKIISLFEKEHGYMNFASLQKHQITIAQINELERKKILNKISRGWYWCEVIANSKPNDYKYIEISKVNPNAIICLESACYLQGLLQEEPEIVTVATNRKDRRKMELPFPIERYYFTDVISGIYQIKNDFGNYNVSELDRCMCDCIRLKNRMSQDVWEEISKSYSIHQNRCTDRLLKYAHELRAVRNVKEYLGNI